MATINSYWPRHGSPPVAAGSAVGSSGTTWRAGPAPPPLLPGSPELTKRETLFEHLFVPPSDRPKEEDQSAASVDRYPPARLDGDAKRGRREVARRPGRGAGGAWPDVAHGRACHRDGSSEGLRSRLAARAARSGTQGAGPAEKGCAHSWAPGIGGRPQSPRPSKASLGLSMTERAATPPRGERSRPQRRTAWRGRPAGGYRVGCRECARRGAPLGQCAPPARRLSIPAGRTHWRPVERHAQ
jgi:hypothetical protein